MNARRRPSRSGFTLVEMMIVIGGVTIILGLCGSLLHSLLRLNRSGREALNDTTTLASLARQFRQDVRACDGRKLEADGSLALNRPDGPAISYRRDGTRLIREEREGEKVSRRESYNVARLGPVGFEVDFPLARLIAQRRPSDSPAPARAAVVVEARIGKDRPQGKPAESSK